MILNCHNDYTVQEFFPKLGEVRFRIEYQDMNEITGNQTLDTDEFYLLITEYESTFVLPRSATSVLDSTE